MPHINENIDELFRKAAEDYPLKTGEPDWEGMRKKFSSKNDAAGNKYRVQLVQYTGVIILFLCIPFAIAINGLKQNEIFSINGDIHAASQEKKTVLPVTSSSEIAVNSMKQNAEKFSLKNLSNDRYFDYTNNNDGQNIIIRKETPKDLSLVAINNPITATSDILQTDLNAKQTSHFITTVDEAANAAKQMTAEKSNKKRTFNITLSTPKNLYVGLLVSPELTNVKRQTFGKPGLNFGFVVGYNFSNRLQAEVAVVRAHKYYYTDGKYAAPNSIRHDESQITGINVFCSVTEIPVTVHYTFNDNGKSKFFAAAGTVSNIVHREQYNYEYEKNGHEREGFKKYYKSAENLFSNIQLSAGYEKTIGTIGTIRIEPYYRIPLNGIGTSNLPVTSTGINIGLLKYFK